MSSKAQPHDNDRARSGHEVSRPGPQGAATHDPQTAPVNAARRAKVSPRSLTPGDVLQLQPVLGNRAVSNLLAEAGPPRRPLQRQPASTSGNEGKPPESGVVQMISANRVEYQHNRKVVTDDKGHVTELKTPIDISFGTEDHSQYFAEERSEAQLTGLRTIRWEMDDDWWAAAYYHAYKGKKPTGPAKRWLEQIEADNCGRMSASDGHSLTTDTKKKAPHFDERWYGVLNKAIVKGTGVIEDTETERRAVKAETARAVEKKRDEKRASALKSVGGGVLGLAWYPDDPSETWEATQQEAKQNGWEWGPS